VIDRDKVGVICNATGSVTRGGNGAGNTSLSPKYYGESLSLHVSRIRSCLPRNTSAKLPGAGHGILLKVSADSSPARARHVYGDPRTAPRTEEEQLSRSLSVSDEKVYDRVVSSLLNQVRSASGPARSGGITMRRKVAVYLNGASKFTFQVGDLDITVAAKSPASEEQVGPYFEVSGVEPAYVEYPETPRPHVPMAPSPPPEPMGE
jgi:hypothetical protein